MTIAGNEEHSRGGESVKHKLWMQCLFWTIAAVATGAHGFQLAPVGTRHEVTDSNVNTTRIWGQAKLLQLHGVELFASPVHETLTQFIFSCDFDWTRCADPDLELAGPYIMAGVRWNDDPGFELSSDQGRSAGCEPDSITFMRQTLCWIKLFKDAEKRARQTPQEFMGPGRKSNLMTRSHFGDLQFLHAMASADNVPASQARDKVMMWARFTWGVATGEYTLSTNLGDIKLPGWNEHFVPGPNVQDLMTIGRRSVRPHIKHVAFGSLLHVLQDSFSRSHVVRREPIAGQRCAANQHGQLGRIASFSAYANQDHGTHGDFDSEAEAKKHRDMDPDLIDAGRILKDMFDRSAKWEEVEVYLQECVFVLENPGALSGPGNAPLN